MEGRVRVSLCELPVENFFAASNPSGSVVIITAPSSDMTKTSLLLTLGNIAIERPDSIS
jgi:hypothetical protein